MVTECRRAHAAIGNTAWLQTEDTSLRRSLYFAKTIPKGHILGIDDFSTARPALGLHPGKIKELIGKKLNQSVKAHQPVKEDCYE